MNYDTHSKSHLLIGAAQVLVGLLIIWAPLPFGSVRPTWIFAIEAAVLLLLVLWVVLQVVRGEISLIKTGLAWPFILLLGYLLVSLAPIPPRLLALLSNEAHGMYQFAADTISAIGKSTPPDFRVTLNPFETEEELLKLISYVLFFFLALHLLRYNHGFQRLYRLLIGLGAAIGLYGVIQNVWSNGKIYWIYESGSGTPFGPFVNHNHFAGYLELSLGLSIGLWLAELRRFRRSTGLPGPAGYFAWTWHKEGGRVWVLAVAIFIMITALTVSLSRGGMLSFVCTALLSSGIALLSRRKEAEVPIPERSRYRLILILAALSALLLVIGIFAHTPHMRGRYRIDESASYRVQVWQNSLNAISDFPLTGAGLGAFRSLFPRYKTGAYLSEATHAENEYLQWIMETGLLGTALLLWAGLIFLHRAYRRFKSRRNFYTRCLAYGTFFSITSLSIHNLMDFNTHIPSNALTLSAILALCMVVLHHHESKQGERFLFEVRRLPVRSVGGISLLLLTLLGVCIFAQRAFSHFRGAQQALEWGKLQTRQNQKGSDQKRLSILSESLRWSPLNDRPHYLKAAAYEAESAQKGLFQFALRHALLSKAEEEILEAIRLCPVQAHSWALLGRIEASLQNFEVSERSFRQALKLAGTDGFLHRDYGQALLLMGDVRAAASHFSLARAYVPGLSLHEMLEALSARTSERGVWESIIKYEASDLKEYADFLTSRGLADLAEQFLKQAGELERKPAAPPVK
jgi:O-antigen ligase